MFCSKCGIKLPNNAKFCFCCGAHMQQFAQKESVRGEERIEKQGDISFVNPYEIHSCINSRISDDR